MKRTALALAVILVLSLLAMASAQSVKVAEANPMAFLPYITIKSDGSVEPQTGFIKRDGAVYTLTSDLVRNYAIKIQRSNIIFDGAGHVINGSITSGYGFANTGLTIEGVTNVTVKNVEVRGFIDADIRIKNTSNSTFLRVIARLFYVENSDLNTITESVVVDYSLAKYSNLLLLYSNNNVIMKNNITDVVDLSGSYSNIFFENSFSRKIFAGFAENMWDNGSVGNYWTSYKGVDANGDGIGDTPYLIGEETWDHYPLMNPWDPTKPFDTVPPRISIDSPENKVYNSSSIPLVFSIVEPSSSISYSLNGQENVTITGNTTLNDLPNGSYNLTVYVTDRSGNVGVSQIINFAVSKPEPFPAAPVTAVSMGLVTVAGAGLLVYFRKIKRKSR